MSGTGPDAAAATHSTAEPAEGEEPTPGPPEKATEDDDAVDEDSEDSFPASDPPSAW